MMILSVEDREALMMTDSRVVGVGSRLFFVWIVLMAMASLLNRSLVDYTVWVNGFSVMVLLVSWSLFSYMKRANYAIAAFPCPRFGVENERTVAIVTLSMAMSVLIMGMFSIDGTAYDMWVWTMLPLSMGLLMLMTLCINASNRIRSTFRIDMSKKLRVKPLSP
jgi:hypothetical protein